MNTLFKGRQSARFEAGRVLHEDALRFEKEHQEALKEEKELQRQPMVFAKALNRNRINKLNESTQAYRNTVDTIVAGIVYNTLTESAKNSVTLSQVNASIKDFTKSIKPLVEDSNHIYRMPMLPTRGFSDHSHHSHHHVGRNDQTLHDLIKKVSMAHMIALRKNSSSKENPEVGFITAYNNIDTTIETGSRKTVTQLDVHHNPLNLQEQVNTYSSEIKQLCEQVGLAIKNRVLKAFNEERERQSALKESKELKMQMLSEGTFSDMEVNNLDKKIKRDSLKKNSVFQECFLFTKLLNENKNPSNEMILQESVFNMAILETYKELGLVKGENLQHNLFLLRRDLQKSKMSY